MLQIEKEHKKSTLMSKQKKDLVEQIMYLEHNNNVLNERVNQQAVNFNKLCKDCNNGTNKEAEEVVFCVVREKNFTTEVFGIYKTSKRAEIIASKMAEETGVNFYVETRAVL